MKAMFASAALALLIAGTASAQNAGPSEDKGWQFRTPGETSVLQNNLLIMEQRKMGLIGGVPGFGGGAGLGSAQATNNFYQFIDQSTITNNCSASAAGSPVTCSGNTNNSTNNQTSNNSNADASVNVEGNTIDTTNNVATSQNGTATVSPLPGPQE